MGKTWVYGDPHPKTWRETADILKENQAVKKPKKPGRMYDRLLELENIVKEKQ